LSLAKEHGARLIVMGLTGTGRCTICWWECDECGVEGGGLPGADRACDREGEGKEGRFEQKVAKVAARLRRNQMRISDCGLRNENICRLRGSEKNVRMLRKISGLALQRGEGEFEHKVTKERNGEEPRMDADGNGL